MERVSLSSPPASVLCTVQRAVIHESSSEGSGGRCRSLGPFCPRWRIATGRVFWFRAVPRGAPPLCVCVVHLICEEVTEPCFKPSGPLAINLLSWLSLQTLPNLIPRRTNRLGFTLELILNSFLSPLPLLAWHPGINVIDGAETRLLE